MTFGNVEFHLPIGLPLCKAIQVILQDLAINGGFYIPIQNAIISEENGTIGKDRWLVNINGSVRGSPNSTNGNFTNGTIGITIVTKGITNGTIGIIGEWYH